MSYNKRQDASLHESEGKCVMLLGLDVLPEYRKQGLGRELVFTYCRREQENGRKMLVLTCHEGWRFSPAYDLTYSDTYWGEQTTSVAGKGKNISDNDLVKTGMNAGIPKMFCEDCLEEIEIKTKALEEYLGDRSLRKNKKIPIAKRIKEIKAKK